MAQIDLGKLRFQWQGLWTTATAYEVDDVVHHLGSTYVVVTAVAATNVLEPQESNAFELMARGVNFRGPYDAQAEYVHLEVVTFEDASWISVVEGPFTGQQPSDASAFWDLLTPAPDPNVLTTSGDLVFVNNNNATERLPIGDEGSSLTVIKSPRQDFAEGFNYTVGTGATATAIATDVNDVNNVFGDNTTNAAITLSRGRVYSITFPADGQTYSIKNPADAAYNTAGAGGRILAGVTPDIVTNGGTILFSPDENTPNTVVVRNEAGGADEVTITLVNMRYVPSWTGPSYRSYKGLSCASNFYNKVTQGIVTLPNFTQKFGRGNNSTGCQGQLKAGYLTQGGDFVAAGRLAHDGTTQTLGSYAYGSDPYPSGGTDGGFGLLTNFRMPTFWFNAIAGDPAYAHFLTDLDGNNLGCENIFDVPKIINYELGDTQAVFLLANGMLFASGDRGSGLLGNGDTTASYMQRPCVVSFYDQNGTQLLGTDYPKIKWFSSGLSTASLAVPDRSYFAIDIDGHVYAWGQNDSGALADGTTTDNFFARRIDPAAFDNQEIVYIAVNGDTDCSVFAITETGRCWAWGNNADGQLGINNLVDQANPVEVTAVAGSPLNLNTAGQEGRQIIHIMTASGGTATEHQTWFLTATGEIFFAGHSQLFGAHSGVYNSATTVDQQMPIALTDSATTINADGHFVVSMWHSGGSDGTGYAVRDDGLIFSWGNNADGQLGRNAPLAHGNSATVQGDWFLAECQFSNMGDTWDSTLYANANPVEGPRGFFADGQGGAHRLKIGNPVKFVSNGLGANTDYGVMMLDDNGQVWICGQWITFNPNPYTEFDSNTLTTAGLDFYNIWVPCWSQPEEFVDISMPSMTSTSQNWMAVGKSGTVYGGGYGSVKEVTGGTSCLTGWTPHILSVN